MGFRTLHQGHTPTNFLGAAPAVPTIDASARRGHRGAAGAARWPTTPGDSFPANFFVRCQITVLGGGPAPHGPLSTAEPIGTHPRVFLEHPAADILGSSARTAPLRRLINPILRQPLDHDPPEFPVEPPDLGDTQSGINARPVDLRGRNIDLDSKIRIGIIGYILGLASTASAIIVSFSAAKSNFRPPPGHERSGAPGRLTQARAGDLQFLRDQFRESTHASSSPVVEPARGPELDIFPVIVGMDIGARRDRVHELFVERPIDIADHDPFFRDGCHLVELFNSGTEAAKDRER